MERRERESHSCVALTCDEHPDLCVSGLRDLSKVVGLMRRSVKPPCSGCSGAGSSSFSNTEEKSSLRTCSTNNTSAQQESIKHMDWPGENPLFLTF